MTRRALLAVALAPLLPRRTPDDGWHSLVVEQELTGVVTHVYVDGHALSSAEVRSRYYEAVLAARPVAYWRGLDDSGGPVGFPILH